MPRSARTLPEALRQFLGFRSPRMLLGCLFLALVARVWVGEYSWTDLVWPVLVMAVQPFLEWCLHVFVLHAKPVRLGPLTVDTVVAQDHRAHHADPRDLPLVFIPFRWCLYLIVGVVAVGLLIPGWPARTSFYVAAFAMAVIYEWSHYLIHSDVRPRNRLFRYLHTNHRLHHYRNEQYWFGITNTLGDQVIGTAPGKEDVQVSATAKNLHGGEFDTRGAGV